MEFLEALKSTIIEWSKTPIKDEWIFEKFRRVYIEKLSVKEAYEFLDQTFNLFVLEHDEWNKIEILKTILCLIEHANTTETPTFLKHNSSQLREAFISAETNTLKTLIKKTYSFFRVVM